MIDKYLLVEWINVGEKSTRPSDLGSKNQDLMKPLIISRFAQAVVILSLAAVVLANDPYAAPYKQPYKQEYYAEVSSLKKRHHTALPIMTI